MSSKRMIWILAALSSIAAPTFATDVQPDAAALKAFSELVKSYRDRPALTVHSTVTIELSDGGNPPTISKGAEVKGDFIFGPDRQAVIKLRGFTCYLRSDATQPDSGTISAIHEKTDHSYFTSADDGSPYYALLTAFQDMPFPELAIMLGEDDIDDVLIQFHPRAVNGVIPTSLSSVDQDGRRLQMITLTGENEIARVYVDGETKLIDSIELNITGGAMVRDAATMLYRHRYSYETHEQPLDASTFVLDPGQRQRVDVMAALLPRPDPAAMAADEAEQDRGGLVGQEAPNFILSTADGGAVDLAELRGNVVVLDFWASWCGPCMTALPKLHDVAKWASQEQLPVKILTVNIREIQGEGDSPDARLKSATSTWKKRNFTLPIVMDYRDETAMSYQISGIPTTVVIRSDGVVHATHVGSGPNYVDSLKNDIAEALKAVE